MSSAYLRERYRAERDKRLRSEGADQYREPTGRFAHLLEDPFSARTEREPVVADLDVAIIGGGFGGLCTGARLKEAGVTDVRIIEGGGDVGGVWYWNRYPGALCDTAAMIYLPLLEETGYTPTRKYTEGAENLAHARRIARHYELYDGALLGTEVTELRWNAERSRWIVRTNRGDELAARFVASGTGPLHRPKLPGIPGLETFGGHVFHTSRWDYDYTGGDSDGTPMSQLGDKVVGVVGTGATAVQCIPHLARSARELHVFQRTPSSIDVRNNETLHSETLDSLEPGWQREWLLNFATLQTGGFTETDLVKDGWTDIAQRIRDRVVAALANGDGSFDAETLQRAYEDSDDEKMSEIRSRVDAVVDDPATAEALKPWYRQLCKRPCFHDEYLQAYNEPSVHLVDTDGRGVDRIDHDGAWVDEVHTELDCLILASGFEVGTDQARRSGFEVTGCDGQTLSECWEDGMVSLHGLHVRGFPNFFVIGFAQGARLISNITHNLSDAGSTIASVISHAIELGAEQVEPTADAQGAWVELMDQENSSIIGGVDCTPGYYNNEGRPTGRRERLNMAGYPDGPVAYFDHIDRWRRSGRFEGLTFR